MPEMAPMILPPAITIPVDDARPQLVKSKKKRRKARRKAATVAAIGAIIVLSDGSKCEVAGHDKQGNPLCYPVQE